ADATPGPGGAVPHGEPRETMVLARSREWEAPVRVRGRWAEVHVMSNVGLDEALRALLREVVRDELPAALRDVLAPLMKERAAAPTTPALTAGTVELLTVGQVAASLQ